MTDYELYKSKLSKIADVGFASAVLSWDQETYMPENGAAIRAQQLATLAGIAHEMYTDKSFEDILQKLESKDLDEKQSKNVALTLKDFKRQKKYSTAFVEEMSRAVSEAFQAWQKAKKENNYSLYEPHLQKLIELKRKECELLGYEKHPYDALLDLYEPGAKTEDLIKVFEGVKKELVPLVKQIAAAKQNEDSFLYKHYDKDKQWNFGIDLLKQMGYDLKSGRQDLSSHPFTIHFNSNDVRVTTRISESNFNEMTWSCIHEGGHALYEQGLPIEDYGLPSAEAVSLGIHESQSRLWENNVGRSLEFWQHNFPALQKLFPESLSKVSAEDFYKAINLVKPSFIRTNADELTYHFHVLIRFEIEKAIIEGKANAKDLPALWNSKYKEYLGIDVPSDDKGVLQDIHWSHGSFGYFPTYSLGSFYAAQFFNTAEKQIPGLKDNIKKGNHTALLKWLRENIHQYGRLYTAEELCLRITGEKLNFQYFMDYAKNKYQGIYGLKHSLEK